jgi:hypothetical protein
MFGFDYELVLLWLELCLLKFLLNFGFFGFFGFFLEMVDRFEMSLASFRGRLRGLRLGPNGFFGN